MAGSATETPGAELGVDLEAIERLGKDVKAAAKVLSAREARYVVDLYYTWQRNRIRAANQVRAASGLGEPHAVIDWVCAQSERLEERVRSILAAYARHDRLGRWSLSIKGIGPVIAAGLLANIDVGRTPHVGHLWSFAGVAASGKRWEKGQKRPWNASLKTLCWKAGESFVKVSGSEDAFYGQLYKRFKAEELARNEAGRYAEQAARALAEKKYRKETEAFAAYSAGRLPPAHLHARATRRTVKIFLAHWLDAGHRIHFGRPAPAPYAIAILGHADWIETPNLDLLTDAA